MNIWNLKQIRLLSALCLASAKLSSLEGSCQEEWLLLFTFALAPTSVFYDR